MQVQLSEEPFARVVEIAGELDSGSVEVVRSFFAALDDDDRAVVVDLGAVTFLDSCGLGLLIGAKRRAVQSGADFAVRSVPDHIRTVLHTTGVDRVLDIVDDGVRQT